MNSSILTINIHQTIRVFLVSRLFHDEQIEEPTRHSQMPKIPEFKKFNVQF